MVKISSMQVKTVTLTISAQLHCPSSTSDNGIPHAPLKKAEAIRLGTYNI